MGCPLSTTELDEPETKRLGQILAMAEADLTNNVLPFWTRNTWDDQYGGFITHLDRTGQLTGVTDKYLIPQARIIWSLAAAHRFGLKNNGYLELAGKGAACLTENFWDKDYGGFFWSIKRDGKPIQAGKIMIGHPFPILGLCEYALASGDKDALRWAERTFNLIFEKASDNDLGFFENFTHDWKHSRTWYGERKTLATHLALMEAFALLSRTTGKPEHKEALGNLFHLLLEKSIHPKYGCASELFDRHWLPKRVSERRYKLPRFWASYGHCAKFAWQILDVAGILEIPRSDVERQVVGLVNYALDFGFDQTRGGLARYGPFTGKVTDARGYSRMRLDRESWAQAEMLIAMLELFRWTGDMKYLRGFEKQFEWIWKYQIDHVGGDWYQLTSWKNGQPLRLDKGNDWKTLYHTSRALMRVSQGLRGMGIEPVVT